MKKNYKIINKAKTNEIVNQFKNKTLKDETVITAKDETVITAEDDNLITAEDDIVIEQPITTAEDETLITAEDETLITAEDETVITAEDETLITAEDDTLEIDQISLGGLSDEDEGEDDSLDIEQQSVTSLSDHENEEDVEDDQVNKDLDENDNEELDLGNVSDFLEETDVEEEEEEEEEEESSMKPFYIKQSGFTFMGEIVEERTSVIKYTICTKTNDVYDENDREIGTWNPTDKSFTPK